MRATNEFRETNLKMWSELLTDLFPNGMPSSKRWEDILSMSSVLNHISSKPNSNHMFFPTGGGMDLQGASPYAEESGCLALKTGTKASEVVKPSALLFESCADEPEWAYFRIECLPLQPTGAYEDEEDATDDEAQEEEYTRDTEEVVLVSPGVYAPRSAWDANEFEGEPLPKNAQLIVRNLGGGPLVIFAKGSFYNLASGRGFDAYDARHAKMNAAEFRAYVEKFAKAAADASRA